METFSNNNKIYIGKNSGKEILKEIKKAQNSVKIVSPYLSGSYIKELLALHNQKRKITLITSDDICPPDNFSGFKPSDLLLKNTIKDEDKEKLKSKLKKFSLISFSISLFLLITAIFIKIILYPSIIIWSLSVILLISSYIIKTSKEEYSPLFRIKVFDSKSGETPHSTELIHSKIYIIDEKIAFIGSANFTHSGFNKHYETVIKVSDEKAVLDISKEVEALFNSTALRSKEIHEWAGI